MGAKISWHNHVSSIAKRASQKLGVLFRTRKLYTSEQLLVLYKAQIRPTMEYCSHVWGNAPKHTLRLLDSIQKRAIRLIGDPELSKTLDTLDNSRRVGELSLYYRYFHGKCSADLASLIIPKAVHNRRRTNGSHRYKVQLSLLGPLFLRILLCGEPYHSERNCPVLRFPSNTACVRVCVCVCF